MGKLGLLLLLLLLVSLFALKLNNRARRAKVTYITTCRVHSNLTPFTSGIFLRTDSVAFG